ncbi:MAG: glycosyltransferase family 39 protein [Lachnospiraceae bacterium]|nr:glycosyltransferase family 39 protein [Lachnospiraceae bacterium]
MNFDTQGFCIDLFSLTVVFSALYYADRQIKKNVKYNNGLMCGVSFLTACLWLISRGFSVDNTTWSLYRSPIQIVKSIAYVLGMTHLLNGIGAVFHYLVVSKNKTVTHPLEKFQSYISCLIIMLIVWLPHTITSHPASIECDAWDSLYQYYGRAEFTAHHPPVFTILLGWFADFGRLIGDINVGFFMWTMLQTLCCAAIMAYVLYTMNLLKTPRWLVILSFAIAAVSPFYTCYITTIVKDTMYSFAVLLYMVELVYMHISREKYWKSPKHICLLWISNIVMLLFRYNGKYIIYGVTIYLIVKCVFNREKLKARVTKKYFVQAFILMILPLLLSKGIVNVAVKHYQVTIQEGESMRETLSIPFQQSARYAKCYSDETPDEEKEIIDKVIDYYALANVYEPEISDPVKSRFHYYATKEDWKEYFRVWFKQFLRHPFTYFGATLNQNYCLIYPQRENSRFYYSTYVDYFYDHDFMDEMGAAQEMTFSNANAARIELYKLLHSMPITGAFSNIAVYNIVIMYMILFAICDKKRGALWILIPIILSDLVVLAGPAIYDNIRYALPVVYSVPLALAYFIRIYNTGYEI